MPPEVPALYGARTILIDEAGRETGRSLRFRAAPGFANALVQSIAGGNTMLFNPAAKALMEAARPAAVIAHDWWIYLLVSGAGGRVIYDPEPTVRYRQHGGNLIGGNLGLGARLARLRMLAAGRLAEYSDVNLAALESAGALITPEARAKIALMRQRSRAAAQAAAGLPAPDRPLPPDPRRHADALARLRGRPALAGGPAGPATPREWGLRL